MRPLTLAFLLGAVAAALLPAPARANGLGEAWASFERALATFDPVGSHVLKPIERTSPALVLNGSYYFWSDVLVTEDQRVGYRHKDFRALQFQNLLELELRYRFLESFEFTSITHVLYDGVYDIQDSTGLFADQYNEDFRYYHDFNRIARELYVSYRRPTLDVVIGKQQIVWGKMDGRFIDVINAIDVRESVQLEASDYEIRRLPAWMANLTYFFGGSSLNFLWIPDFQGDRRADYGSPWFSPLIPPEDTEAKQNPALLHGRETPAGNTRLSVKEPDWKDIGDHEFAVRLDVPTGAFTWGLIYYYAWDRLPNNYIVGTDENGEVYEPRHSRLHHVGLTADYSSALPSLPLIGGSPLVLRVEALLTHGVVLRDDDNSSGLSKRDTLRAAVALELALPRNTTLIFQPSFFFTFNWDESLGSGFGSAVEDEWALIPVVSVSRPLRMTNDRLNLSVTVLPYISGPRRGLQGVKTRLVASYEFSQFISGRLMFTDYSGGDKTDLFGQYKKWKNIGVELQYEF
ncbi:MAG: hypothetical protein JRS35_06600 [Deltaproteobacteria bacterium]|nr:hypothetical protein [Deltaproteobacteria bacterium]